jgi:hypothetical protein
MGPAPEYLQADDAERFSLEPVLEDLAQSADLSSAIFAQRRLEYRSTTLRLAGSTLPSLALLAPLLCAAVSLALLVASRARVTQLSLFRRIGHRRQQGTRQHQC